MSDSRTCRRARSRRCAVVLRWDAACASVRTESMDENPEERRIKKFTVSVHKLAMLSGILTSLFAYKSLANVKSECRPQTRQ